MCVLRAIWFWSGSVASCLLFSHVLVLGAYFALFGAQGCGIYINRKAVSWQPLKGPCVYYTTIGSMPPFGDWGM